MNRNVPRYTYERERREEPMSSREKGRLVRLTVAAGILFLTVALKLISPAALAGVESRIGEPFSRDIELREVVSAFGYLAGGEGESAERWQKVCRAVLAPAEEAKAVSAAADALAAPCYTQENMPAHSRLTQVVLGYAYQTPVEGTLTSGYGLRTSPTAGSEEFHYGLDLAAEEGTEVCAFADGTVRASGESSSYGKYVILDHANDTATLYAHLSRSDVKAGDTVKMGDAIAAVGQTGNATGPHLHFELQKAEDFVDPIYYVETK